MKGVGSKWEGSCRGTGRCREKGKHNWDIVYEDKKTFSILKSQFDSIQKTFLFKQIPKPWNQGSLSEQQVFIFSVHQVQGSLEDLSHSIVHPNQTVNWEVCTCLHGKFLSWDQKTLVIVVYHLPLCYKLYWYSKNQSYQWATATWFHI